MPDKYITSFIELGMVKLVLDDLKTYARANTIMNLLKILTYLSTHQDCRAYILKFNGLEQALEYAEYTEDKIKFQAIKLIANLT